MPMAERDSCRQPVREAIQPTALFQTALDLDAGGAQGLIHGCMARCGQTRGCEALSLMPAPLVRASAITSGVQCLRTLGLDREGTWGQSPAC